MEKLVPHQIKLNRVFLIIFEIALLLRLVALYSLIDSRFDTILFSLITVLGGILFFMNLIIWVKNRERPNIWLVLFIVSMIISSILNGPVNLIGNFKLIIWQVIFFFVVFYSSQLKDEKLMRYFENVLFYFWNVAIFISLFMFITRFSYSAPLSKLYYGLRLGFFQNRLYGIFTDPNFAANVSAVVILLLVKRIWNSNFSAIKLFGTWILIFLNFVYIVVSGSRTVLLETSVIVFVGTFFICYSKIWSRTMLKRWLLSIIVGIFGTLLFIGADYTVQKLAPLVSTPINYFPDDPAKEHKVELEQDDENLSLVRSDVTDKADVSNGRLALWKSAIEIFSHSPIYGTSPRGFINYAQKKLPDTRIAHTQQTPHNFLLYTLLGTGLIGILPLLIFLIIEYSGLIAALFRNESMNVDFLIDSLIAIMLLIFGMFMPDIIFENRIGALCFWLYLGLVSYQKGFIEKRVNDDSKIEPSRGAK